MFSPKKYSHPFRGRGCVPVQPAQGTLSPAVPQPVKLLRTLLSQGGRSSLVPGPAPREVWWLFGARNHDEHPFAQEARRLLQTLPTVAATSSTVGLDFDAPGRPSVTVLKE